MREEDIEFKFDDCLTCKFRFKPWLYCETECDMGESYEPDDIDEVDKDFRGRI